MASSSSIAVSVRDLNKQFKSTRDISNLVRFWKKREITAALTDVNLQVKRGELVTLVGPNGAGKSTLLKAISTIIRANHGTIEVMGYDVAQNPRKVREQVGYILADERSFYWRLSCRENLRFFGALQGLYGDKCAERIAELSAMFGLSQQLDKQFMNLSTGQRQRLAIARGLIADPPVVLFDEATRSLDPGRAERLRWIVRELLVNQKKKSVLFASHNLDEVQAISDRCALMVAGRLIHVDRFEAIESEIREAFAAEAKAENAEFDRIFGAATS
jgi:ABC-2 type transport system ATP-binding protein